jgi:hypothetical protein
MVSMTLLRPFVVGTLLAALAGPALAQAPAGPAPSRSVYVAVLRTGKHARFARARTWQEAQDGVFALLRSYAAGTSEDPLRLRLVTEQELPVQSLARLAREAGAGELLQVTIDRPVTRWIKITFACFDAEAGKEWEESADYGGGISGKDAVSLTLERLKVRLDAHAGGACLPRP